MKKKLVLIMSLFFMSLLITGSIVSASSNDRSTVYEKTLLLTKDELVGSGATQLDLSFNIGGAKVYLAQSVAEDVIVEALVRYSDERLEPNLTTILFYDRYIVDFKSGVIKKYKPGTVHEWYIIIGSYEVDTKLAINLGGVLADLDLGTMPLATLVLNLGGDSVNINFSSPTSRSVKNLNVNCGGAYLSMTNIGNTDFDRFTLDSGGSALRLDFHGVYSNGEHEIDMNLGAVALETNVPMYAGEHLQVFKAVSGVIVVGEGWEKVVNKPFYKEYITSDYDVKDIRLDLRVFTASSGIFIERS